MTPQPSPPPRNADDIVDNNTEVADPALPTPSPDPDDSDLYGLSPPRSQPSSDTTDPPTSVSQNLDSEPDYKQVLRAAFNAGAHALFKLAWPTARYEKYEFIGPTNPKLTTTGASFDIAVRLHGYGFSTAKDGRISVDAALTVGCEKEGGCYVKIRGWGDYEGAVVPPGTVVGLAKKLLMKPK